MWLSKIQAKILKAIIDGHSPADLQFGLSRTRKGGISNSINFLLRNGIINRDHKLTELGTEIVREEGLLLSPRNNGS